MHAGPPFVQIDLEAPGGNDTFMHVPDPIAQDPESGEMQFTYVSTTYAHITHARSLQHDPCSLCCWAWKKTESRIITVPSNLKSVWFLQVCAALGRGAAVLPRGPT